jgi:enoyl-CoA hydratase
VSTPTDDYGVITTVTDGVAEILLNRPRALNALDGKMHHGILDGLKRAEADDVRVVVLRGAGRAFSAGGDTKAVARGEDVGHPIDLATAIWNLPKPVIAAIHGYCLGQAYEFSSVCDLSIAAQSAQFGEVEVKNGWGPPIAITPYVVGLKHAKEILLLGELLDADWALRAGLVNRVVPDDELDAEVAKVVAQICALKPEVLAKNKKIVNSVYEASGILDGLILSQTLGD